MKRIFAAILIITVVISLGVVITFGEETTRGKNYYDSKSASKMEKTLYNVSKGLKKVKKKDSDNILTDLDESELDERAQIVAESSNRDKQEVKDELEKSLERKKALYWAAKEAGCSVTDNEIEQAIQETKDALHSEKEAEDEFKAVLSGMEVEENEYWKMLREQYEIDLLVNKYIEEQLKKKEKNNKNMSSDNYETKKKWQEEIEKTAIKNFDRNKRTSGAK